MRGEKTDTTQQPKQQPAVPLLVRESDALRLLRELARIDRSIRPTPYRPDRTNRYVLPQ